MKKTKTVKAFTPSELAIIAYVFAHLEMQEREHLAFEYTPPLRKEERENGEKRLKDIRGIIEKAMAGAKKKPVKKGEK